MLVSRRTFVATVGAIGCGSLVAFRSLAQGTDSLAKFSAELKVAAADPDMIEDAHAFSEAAYRQRGPTSDDFAIQPHLPRTYMSSKEVFDPARNMMIAFEVSSAEIYNKRYVRPILPGVKSGLTIGIGYDLGYTKPQDFEEDWSPFLDPDAISQLKPACGHTGLSDVTNPSNYTGVTIPWSAATKQFAVAVKQTAGQTEHVFPGSSDLSDACFGALVDLIYNRGGGMKRDPADPDDRRREMRNIRQFILTGNLSAVPEQLISMTRLWEGDPKAKGLLKRRELEAELFTAGIP